MGAPDPVQRIGIAEAALLTGISKRTLLDHAETIPGSLKVDRRWTFDPSGNQLWFDQAEARKHDEDDARALNRRIPCRAWLARRAVGDREPDRVYFIRSGDRHIKIGVAFNPKARLRELQVGSPEKLILLTHIKGGRKAENHLHRFYAVERIRGEWFELSDRLRAFLERLGVKG